MKLKQIPSPIPGTSTYLMGECSVIVAKELGLYHLSIAHPRRYPTWEEIKEARYRLLPNEITVAMLLPPKELYVNVHQNCFHLYEVTDPRDKQEIPK